MLIRAKLERRRKDKTWNCKVLTLNSASVVDNTIDNEDRAGGAGGAGGEANSELPFLFCQSSNTSFDGESCNTSSPVLIISWGCSKRW